MKTTIYYKVDDIPSSNSKRILVQVFTSLKDIQDVLSLTSRLENIMPHAAIIGASSPVKIAYGDLSFEESIIAVTEMEFSSAETAAVINDHRVDKSIKTAFNALFRKRKNPKLAIVFGTATVNGDSVLKATETADKRIVVVGGLTNYLDDNLKINYTFDKNGVYTNGIVVAMIYGERLEIVNHIDVSWTPVGNIMHVTKSNNGLVHEIDNMSAISVYKRYFGTEAVEVIKEKPQVGLEYPLLIEDADIIKPRALLRVNDDGSILYAGNIKEGSQVRFGIADIGSDVLAPVSSDMGMAQSIFVYSCIVRHWIGGENIALETHYLNDITTTVGMFTYGEFFNQSPADNACNCFMNQSLTVVGLLETGSKDAKYTEMDSSRLFKNEVSLESVNRRALTHFTRVVTSELMEANRTQREANEKERHLRETLEYQFRQSSVSDMMEFVRIQVLESLNRISAIASKVDFDLSLNSSEMQEVKALKHEIDKSIKETENTLDTFSNFIDTQLDISSFSIKDALKEVYTIISVPLQKQGIEIVAKVISDELHGQNDIVITSRKGILQKAIISLIINAIESIQKSSDSGLIEIVVQKVDDILSIAIIDTGAGVELLNLDAIFECGFSTKTGLYASGIGLYVVRTSVERYLNGKISAYSRDNKMVFEITIPEL